jgi:hypothetical protein
MGYINSLARAQEISYTKTVVTENVLPYRLLRPISELLVGGWLRGIQIARSQSKPLDSGSGTNPGERLHAFHFYYLPLFSTGCGECCYSLRERERPAKPGPVHSTLRKSVPVTRGHSFSTRLQDCRSSPSYRNGTMAVWKGGETRGLCAGLQRICRYVSPRAGLLQLLYLKRRFHHNEGLVVWLGTTFSCPPSLIRNRCRI